MGLCKGTLASSLRLTRADLLNDLADLLGGGHRLVVSMVADGAIADRGADQIPVGVKDLCRPLPIPVDIPITPHHDNPSDIGFLGGLEILVAGIHEESIFQESILDTLHPRLAMLALRQLPPVDDVILVELVLSDLLVRGDPALRSRLGATLDDHMGLIERLGMLGHVLVDLDVTGFTDRHQILRELLTHPLIGDVVEMELVMALAAIARTLAVLPLHGGPVSTADVRVVGSVTRLSSEEI